MPPESDIGRRKWKSSPNDASSSNDGKRGSGPPEAIDENNLRMCSLMSRQFGAEGVSMPANVSIKVSCEPEKMKEIENAIVGLFRDRPPVVTVNLREERTDDSWEISILNLDGKRVWQHTLSGGGGDYSVAEVVKALERSSVLHKR
jgi:hypothetical protein